MKEILYRPIGTIHSPFKEIAGMPIQQIGAQDVKATIDIEPAYVEGLKDLDGFSHIILIYHFHRAGECKLQVKPYLDEVTHGVFSTRAPVRPNPIGISIVKLISIAGCTLHVEAVDILDGTPLLDIKPYVPSFDVRSADRTGWLSGKAEEAREKKQTKDSNKFPLREFYLGWEIVQTPSAQFEARAKIQTVSGISQTKKSQTLSAESVPACGQSRRRPRQKSR